MTDLNESFVERGSSVLVGNYGRAPIAIVRATMLPASPGILTNMAVVEPPYWAP